MPVSERSSPIPVTVKMSEASERDEVERRGFKAALTRSRRIVEQDIEDHPDGEDPTFLNSVLRCGAKDGSSSKKQKQSFAI